MCDVTHLYVWCDPFVCVTWLICMCDMTHLYVWHDPFVCVMWLICMCDVTHLYVWRDSFVCVTWLICMCDVTHLYVLRDPFVCVIWPICTCDVTNLYVWRDPFVCVTWPICMCDVIHLYVWRDSRMPIFSNYVTAPPLSKCRMVVRVPSTNCDTELRQSACMKLRKTHVPITHVCITHIRQTHIRIRMTHIRKTHIRLTHIRMPIRYMLWVSRHEASKPAWCPDTQDIHPRHISVCLLTWSLVSGPAFGRLPCIFYCLDQGMSHIWDRYTDVYIHTHIYAYTYIHSYIHTLTSKQIPWSMYVTHMSASLTFEWERDMTHFYVWRDSLICVAWLMHMFGRAFGRLRCMIYWTSK